MSATFRVAAIEVTQAIQDLKNSVPLVAGKATVVRVFLDAAPQQVTTVKSLLHFKNASGGAWLAPINDLRLDPADQRTLAERRLDINGSLNFRLPPAATAAGPCGIKVRFKVDDPEATLDFSGADLLTEFVPMPPLRLKVIGFRFTLGDPPVEYQPRDLDYALLESWLKRAFPISELQFKRIVSSPSDFDTNADSTYIHSKLQLTRNTDLASGGDPRVRYYGMITDAHWIRGQTRLEKDRPGPDALSCGPTGRPGPDLSSWDTDGSYGDWYAAHELGHGLGRRHPGSCRGQLVDDRNYPHLKGKISDDLESFAGFDIGDPALENLPMRVYPGTDHHDVMTYCDDLWISAYTYIGIMKQLQADEIWPGSTGLTLL